MVHESVEDTGEITEDSVSERLEPTGGSEVLNDGPGAVESNDLFPQVKGNEPEVLGSVQGMKPEVSPFPTMPRKGYGLKKWKRIKRDYYKSGRGSTETGRMLTQDLLDSGGNTSKRMQDYDGRKQRTNSVSSTDAVVRSLDGFPLHGDSGFGVSPSFSAGTDSENSGDWSSKSSTAASSPTINFGSPVIAGFLLDKSWKRSLDEKTGAHSVQIDHQGKDKIQITKRGRGERVKTEKGSSHSSVHSDSQSSNFVSMQVSYFSNNEIQNERAKDYGGSCDGGQGSGQQGSKEHQEGCNRDVEGENTELLPDDAATNASWDISDELNENLSSSTDQDPLVNSISALQSVQEALEKELLMFKNIGQVNDYVDQNITKTSSEWSLNSETVERLTRAREYDVQEETKKDLEAELEDLFRQKIEAEVVYLITSRMVQKLRVASVDQITIMKEQIALLSEHAQILNELGDTESKAVMLKNKAEKLEAVCENIDIADEALKLQKRVCKYGSCFILQLVLFAVALTFFIYQISHHFVEPVPT